MTAVITGTSTDFWDFYNELRDQLIAHADLVTASEEWSQIAGNTGVLNSSDYEYIIEGPGASGTDQIRVYVGASVDSGSGRYNIILRGITSYNPSLAPSDQIGISDLVCIPLWNGSIPYVIVASGRRFVFSCQVSSTFHSGYGGFINAYALPSQYPYPCAVGGSSSDELSLYSDTDYDMSTFVNPNDSLQLCFPDNVWRPFRQYTSPSQRSYLRCVSPYALAVNTLVSVELQLELIRKNFGGEYPLMRLMLNCSDPGKADIGVLDGCFFIPGFENSSGNVLTINAVDYRVIQNTFRTDNLKGYWALALE